MEYDHAHLRLPIIHFSEENLESCANRDRIQSALEEFGCFEAMYDKVTFELHEAIFGLLEDLFDLPLETRCRNSYGHNIALPQHPLFEGFGINDATKFEATRNFTNLIWPKGKSNYCELLHSYVTRIAKLEKMVKKMAFQSLGVEKYYDSHAEKISYLFRVMKYKGPMTDEAKLGLLSHTDRSFFTIQHQNQVPGLEVQTKNGEWIRVTPSSSSFIVMAGDAFHAWSNGRVHSPEHRVMMSGNEARYSTGLFSFSSDLVQCPTELIDEDHPLLYKPFDQQHLLRLFFTPDGKKIESALKAYYGV